MTAPVRRREAMTPADQVLAAAATRRLPPCLICGGHTVRVEGALDLRCRDCAALQTDRRTA